MGPALRTSTQKEHGPDEGHKNYQKAGGSFVGRQAERIGVAQSAEEKAPTRCYSCISVSNGAYKKADKGLFTNVL